MKKISVLFAILAISLAMFSAFISAPKGAIVKNFAVEYFSNKQLKTSPSNSDFTLSGTTPPNCDNRTDIICYGQSSAGHNSQGQPLGTVTSFVMGHWQSDN